MTQATAPAALVAERAMVGALIADPGKIVDVIGVVEPRDCYDERHEHLLALLLLMHRERDPIDLISVAQRTVSRPELYGSPGYVAELPEYSPASTNVRHYAELVAAAAARRKLLEAAAAIQDLARERGRPVDEVLAEARSLVAAVSPPSRGHARWYGEVLDHTISEAEAAYAGRVQRIPTPFQNLNMQLSGGGFRVGHVVVVGARPSMGKSAFVMNILEGMARAGTTCGLFSLEMDAEELGSRGLSGATGIRMDRIATPTSWDLPLADGRNVWDRVVGARDELGQLRLLIDTRPGLGWPAIESEIRRWVQEEGARVVAIDYLQLLPTKSHEHKGAEFGDAMKRSKVLARELGIVIIWLCQLNRGVESRESKAPMMSDLRDTGEIEQVADVIMFLYRPFYYDQSEDPRKAVIPVAKQRGGRTGVVHLDWYGEVQRFTDPPSPEERAREAARTKAEAEDADRRRARAEEEQRTAAAREAARQTTMGERLGER